MPLALTQEDFLVTIYFHHHFNFNSSEEYNEIFSGVLIGGLSLNVVSYLIHLKVNAFAWTDCKFTYFFWYFFHQYSSTLLAMMSIEKCIVVYFPLKTKNICTVKTAKWACLISGIAFAAFNSQHFFITEARLTDANTLLCFNTGVSPKYMSIYYKVDSALYSFAPFAIMGLTNIAIIYKFIKAKMAMKSGTESTNQALSKTAMRGTAILITVSLTFIILTGPISIHYALTSTIDGAIIIFYYIFANLSHGINGLMYCIVGSKFRQELIEFICCGRRSSGRKGKSVTEAGSTQLTAVSTVSTNQGKY